MRGCVPEMLAAALMGVGGAGLRRRRPHGAGRCARGDAQARAHRHDARHPARPADAGVREVDPRRTRADRAARDHHRADHPRRRAHPRVAPRPAGHVRDQRDGPRRGHAISRSRSSPACRPDEGVFTAGPTSTEQLAILPWNEFVLLPKGRDAGDAYSTQASVLAPPDWHLNCALALHAAGRWQHAAGAGIALRA